MSQSNESNEVVGMVAGTMASSHRINQLGAGAVQKGHSCVRGGGQEMLKTRPPKRAKSRSAKGCAKTLYGVANPPPCERSLSEAAAELQRSYSGASPRLL